MIQTNRRLHVYEVTFIPEGKSEPEMHRLDPAQFSDSGTTETTVDTILNEYYQRGEPISLIYVNARGANVNLWGNRRY